MKVVFVSPDYNKIVQLPKSYPETEQYYRAFLDFEDRMTVQGTYCTTQQFLEEFKDWEVYLKADEEVYLLHIGSLQTKYTEATKFFQGIMPLEEVNWISDWFYYSFHKGALE